MSDCMPMWTPSMCQKQFILRYFAHVSILMEMRLCVFSVWSNFSTIEEYDDPFPYLASSWDFLVNCESKLSIPLDLSFFSSLEEHDPFEEYVKSFTIHWRVALSNLERELSDPLLWLVYSGTAEPEDLCVYVSLCMCVCDNVSSIVLKRLTDCVCIPWMTWLGQKKEPWCAAQKVSEIGSMSAMVIVQVSVSHWE